MGVPIIGCGSSVINIGIGVYTLLLVLSESHAYLKSKLIDIEDMAIFGFIAYPVSLIGCILIWTYMCAQETSKGA
tara:strand:- start:248 stop:472 length:225 start_codon:yes stop_codon:yes gene_type:complete